MERQMHDAARHAWQVAENAEARQRAEALAGDVIAYHDALKGAGIAGPLLETLVTQFGAAWVGLPEPAEIESTTMLFGEDA